MTDQKYTEDGLPIVTHETLTSYVRDFEQGGREERVHPLDASRIDSLREKVQAENPLMFAYLSGHVERLARNDGERKEFESLVLTTYELLRRQTVSHSLHEELE